MNLHFSYAISHWLLALAYFIVVGVCFHRHRLRKSSQFWGVFFTTVVILGSVGRGLYWVTIPLVVDHFIFVNSHIMAYWSIFPSFFIWTAYLIILVLWVQVYYRAENFNFRLYFSIMVSVVYVSFLCLVLIDWNLGVFYHSLLPKYETLLLNSLALYVSILYFLSSVGYMVFGIRCDWIRPSCQLSKARRFYCRLHSRPLLSRYRSPQLLPRVVIFSIICTLVFTLRSILVLLDSFLDMFSVAGSPTALPETLMDRSPTSPPNRSPDTYFYSWFDPVYYVPLELVPLVMMMIIFTPQSDSSMDTEIDMSETRA